MFTGFEDSTLVAQWGKANSSISDFGFAGLMKSLLNQIPTVSITVHVGTKFSHLSIHGKE